MSTLWATETNSEQISADNSNEQRYSSQICFAFLRQRQCVLRYPKLRVDEEECGEATQYKEDVCSIVWLVSVKPFTLPCQYRVS